MQVFLSLDGQVIQTADVTQGTDGRWTYTMEPVPRYAALQGKTKLAGAANSVGGSMKKADRTDLQYALRQGDVNGYKWAASLKSVEMDNHDVIATADFTDTLTKEILPDISGEVEIPTPETEGGGTSTGASNVNTQSSQSGGNTVHVGGSTSTINNGSTISSGSTVSSGGSTGRSRSTISDGSQTSSVKTGDDSQPLLMLILMMASLCLIVLCLRKRRTDRVQ